MIANEITETSKLSEKKTRRNLIEWYKVSVGNDLFDLVTELIGFIMNYSPFCTFIVFGRNFKNETKEFSP